MTNFQFHIYSDWLKTISDRHLNDLWLKHCAPSEHVPPGYDPDQALAIHEEMLARDLI